MELNVNVHDLEVLLENKRQLLGIVTSNNDTIKHHKAMLEHQIDKNISQLKFLKTQIKVKQKAVTNGHKSYLTAYNLGRLVERRVTTKNEIKILRFELQQLETKATEELEREISNLNEALQKAVTLQERELKKLKKKRDRKSKSKSKNGNEPEVKIIRAKT